MKWEDARIVVYSDGSHASNKDLSYKLGILIFITDGVKWNLIQAKAYKSRRIVRSPVPAETHALADGAVMAIILQADGKSLTGHVVDINLLADSKFLFEVLSKVSMTLERRLMIDLRTTREVYDQDIIGQLGFIRSEHNLANRMNKLLLSKMMQDFMETGRVNYVVGQFVIKTMRTDVNTSSEE